MLDNVLNIAWHRFPTIYVVVAFLENSVQMVQTYFMFIGKMGLYPRLRKL